MPRGNIGFDAQLSRNRVFGTRITELWFDREYVESRLDKATRKVLSRFGYFVMSDARQSIKKPRQLKLSEMSPRRREQWQELQRIRKEKGLPRMKRPPAPSEPGTPPRNQTGLLKRFIFFSYDKFNQGVVIGPARLAGNRQEPPPPQILEEGGVVRGRNMKRPARIRPRPYMKPAFDRQINKRMPDMWRNAVR